MTCSSPHRIRPPSAFSLALLLLLIGWSPVAAAQQVAVDEGIVGQLAAILEAADARRFDAGALRDGLGHADPGVRRQAALAAGRIGDAAAVDLLIPILQDSVPVVQAAAAFALGLLKDQRAVVPLVQLTRAAPPQTAPQLEAVTAIAKIAGRGDTPEAVRAFAEVVATGSPGAPVPPVVSQALLEAWRLGSQAPVAELVAFTDHADWVVRWRALYSLGRLRAPRGAARLVAALSDREPAVRTIAARGLSKALLDSARLAPRGAIDGLRPLLDDQNPHTRINALRALATFRDTSLAAVVAPLVSDRDLNVAVQAETTLGVTGGATALATLRPRLTSTVFALRRQAAIAVAQADTAAGIAAAEPLAADADWRWRSVAAEAYGAARARDRLEGLLADPDGRVVAQALQALQRTVAATDSSLRGRARALLAHADPAVRSTAAEILGRQPEVADIEELVAAYRRAEADPFNDARLAALAALGGIAAASPTGRLRVAGAFVGAVSRPDDYLVRRLAADTLPDAAEAWGPVAPIATGRTPADYREVARRWLAPALVGQPNPRVTIETDRGALEIELLVLEAPQTVAAFLGLVERRFFDGTRWHRVVPNFVVQDGDPRGDGWGGPGFVLRDEVNPIRYDVGTVGMALSGPDTGGSQYFITHSGQPHLDGIYTVFGRVVTGGTALNAIGMGDRIRSIHR